jgi:hypothetical protein
MTGSLGAGNAEAREVLSGCCWLPRPIPRKPAVPRKGCFPRQPFCFFWNFSASAAFGGNRDVYVKRHRG